MSATLVPLSGFDPHMAGRSRPSLPGPVAGLRPARRRDPGAERSPRAGAGLRAALLRWLAAMPHDFPPR